jgi:hypothetical protein
VVAKVVEGSWHILVAEAAKALVGVSLTVTITLVTGEVQAGGPLFTTARVIVLLPVVLQLKVWGPCPEGLPPIQLSQFQLKVLGGLLVPLQVAKVVALAKEVEVQMVWLETLKALVGVGFTVIRTEVTGDKQAGVELFTTCKVTVLVPVVFQVKVCGPCPVGAAVQPSQFQLKVALGLAVPVQVTVVVALVVEGETQMDEAEGENELVGVSFTVTKTLVIGEVQAGGPLLITVSVMVFVPEVFQLMVCGPFPVGLPPIQELQFQLYVTLVEAPEPV